MLLTLLMVVELLAGQQALGHDCAGGLRKRAGTARVPIVGALIFWLAA